MKSTALLALALAVASSACGAKKPAEEPENTEEGAAEPDASGEVTGTLASEETPAAAPASSAAVKDDAKKQSPCSGFEIPDLLSVISQAACEVPDANPEAKQRNVADILEVRVVPDSPRIAPGSKATITITFKNKGKTDLPLDFVVDPEPRFSFELYTLKGARVDRPAGNEPMLPPEVANAPQPEKKIARVTLAQQGTAKLTLPWEAVKYKWASKERAKGALPGHGYPREPAGPLPKGKYILRVITPLVGVFEGIDHEMSQPRVQIAVGNL
jgi:hypothetical protein